MTQAGDHAAAAAALRPAWDAVEANLHKAPLSPAQRGGPHACSGSAVAAQPLAHCPFLLRFSAAWVYVAMATAGVSLFEKQKRYEEACDTIRKLLGEGAASLILGLSESARELLTCYGDANQHAGRMCSAVPALTHGLSMHDDNAVGRKHLLETGLYIAQGLKLAGVLCAQEGCAVPTGGVNGGCGCPSTPSTWAAQRWPWRRAPMAVAFPLLLGKKDLVQHA